MTEDTDDIDLDFGLDDDEIDLSSSSAGTVVQDRRSYNHGLDAALMLVKLMDSEFRDVQDLISRGFRSTFFPADIQPAVEWLFAFFGDAQAVPSRVALTRKFPTVAELIKDVPTPSERGLVDCYAALRESAVVGCADTGINKLNQLLLDPSISVNDWQLEFNKLHQSLHALTTANRSRFTSGEEIVPEAKVLYEKAKAGETYGMPLPFPFLDLALLGLQKGKIMTILGEPNVGKTWIALMVLLSLATGNKYIFSGPTKWNKVIDKDDLSSFFADQEKYAVKVLFNSLEMTNEEIIQRVACLLSRVNYSRMLRGTLTDEEEKKFIRCLDRAHEIISQNVIIGHSTDINQVITEAETFGARAIINDAFYLFDGPEEKRWERVQSAMSRMRDHSIQTEIAYVLTTQLDETSKNRAMFSQTIRQDSDIMITARRGVQIELTKARNAPIGLKYRYDLDPDTGKYGQQEQINTAPSAGGMHVPSDV